MKRLNMLKVTTIALTFVFATLSCSESDEQNVGCYQEENRKIIETVSNFSATILGPESQDCPLDFIIDPDGELPNNVTGRLAPCNLDDSFKTDSLKVQVSGFIYESFEFEDICGDFFEITEISLTP